MLRVYEHHVVDVWTVSHCVQGPVWGLGWYYDDIGICS